MKRALTAPCFRAQPFFRRASPSAARSTDLVKSVYAAAATEARALGIHMLSTLVMEVDRDPRMGRNEEAYTEDPYFYSRIGETIVRAFLLSSQKPNVDAFVFTCTE